MEVMLVLSVLSLVGIAVAIVGFSRMAWRILSGQEQFEPGGSYSRQAIGRYQEDRKPGEPRRGRLRRLMARRS